MSKNESKNTYIIHGTNIDNLLQILKDGYIDNKPKKKHLMGQNHKPPNQILTQLVYYDIPIRKIIYLIGGLLQLF